MQTPEVHPRRPAYRLSRPSRLPHLMCLIVGLLLAMTADPAFAKRQGRLSPAKVKQIRKTNKSFKECRRAALDGIKTGKFSKKRFALALNNCKERFPGASLWEDCKRRAVREARQKNITPDKGVAACKRFLVAASFDPTEPVPFFVNKGQLYFSGVGMNKTVPVQALDPPNFECERLKAVARNPKEAQYFLFGNHPRTFSGLEAKKGKALLKALSFRRPNPKGVDVQGFGRIFGNPTDSTGVVFFPSGSCNFDGQLGNLFSGQSAYYLLDPANSLVTPYFGIAYYSQNTKLKTKGLIRQVIRALGSNFKPYQKNQAVTFIAASSVSETDDEQDPKNLCRKPRAHRFVAVVQGRRDDPGTPEYLIVANIKNLCDYGDRRSKRLNN